MFLTLALCLSNLTYVCIIGINVIFHVFYESKIESQTEFRFRLLQKLFGKTSNTISYSTVPVRFSCF